MALTEAIEAAKQVAVAASMIVAGVGVTGELADDEDDE